MASHIHRIIIFSHRHSNTKEDSPSYSHTLRTCATLPSLAKLQGGHVSYELCGLPSHPLICHNMLSRVTICGCIVLCCVRHDSCSYSTTTTTSMGRRRRGKQELIYCWHVYHHHHATPERRAEFECRMTICRFTAALAESEVVIHLQSSV